MSLQLCRHASALSFLARVQPMLLEREAENNLILGVAGDLVKDPSRYPELPYLASIEQGDAVVSCAMRTPPYKLVMTRLPGHDFTLLVDDLYELYPHLPGVVAPKEVSESFADLWSRRTGSGIREGMKLRIYQLERVRIEIDKYPGRFRLCTEADLELARKWTKAFCNDAAADEPMDTGELASRKVASRSLYFWEDPEPVSMAAWTGRTPNGVRINLVYTPPELRRRGYATACTASLSQLLLDSGSLFCYLFTDLQNPTSNSIYQQIGYRPVCDFNEFYFDYPAAPSEGDEPLPENSVKHVIRAKMGSGRRS